MTAPNFTIWDVPVIGPWYGKVSHITDIWGTPCAVDNIVGFYAFWQALPRLLITLTKPDSFDLVTDRWGRKHKRRRFKRFTIQDLILPIAEPKGVGPAWVFYRLGSWAERLGWYMLIADATLDFAIHWTSTAYTWQGCQVPGSPFAKSDVPEAFILGGGPGLYEVGEWIVRDTHIMTADGASIACPAGFDASAAVMIRQLPLGLPLPEGEISEVQIYDTAQDAVWASGPMSRLPGGYGQASLMNREWGFAQPSHRWVVRLRKGDGFVKFQGDFWASGTKSVGITYDP